MTTQSTMEQVGQENAERTPTGPVFRPNVDIQERPDELVVLADIPGANKDDIEVNFEDGTLTIQARIKPRQTEKHQYLLREYGVGDFYRVFRVSEQIDPTRISAQYGDGVLTLHLPKSEAVKPRKSRLRNCRDREELWLP